MGKFEDAFDEFIEKARQAADIAGKKTTEMVEYGKLKYKAKTVAWDIEKAYTKLGALVYESRKSGESCEDAVGLAVEAIDALNEKLDELEDLLAEVKSSSVKETRAKPKDADEEPAAPEEEQ
ncbi:MAG: hypothetical protein FWH02_01705 [Oscillospiraceae bacterium]|nr:hypothetical protein [Oscillospiraceae bacterium]